MYPYIGRQTCRCAAGVREDKECIEPRRKRAEHSANCTENTSVNSGHHRHRRRRRHIDRAAARRVAAAAGVLAKAAAASPGARTRMPEPGLPPGQGVYLPFAAAAPGAEG